MDRERGLRARGPGPLPRRPERASSSPAASAIAGSEGKIRAARFARERQTPYFGICFGMQMAVIEAVRSLSGIEKAGSSEFGPTDEPVVGLMTEWLRGNELEKTRRTGRSRRHDAARRL